MLNVEILSENFYSIMNGSKKINSIEDSAKLWANALKEYYKKMIIPIHYKAIVAADNLFLIFEKSLIVAMKARLFTQQLERLINVLHTSLCKAVDLLFVGIWTTKKPNFKLNLKDCFSYNFSAQQIARKLAVKIHTWVSFTLTFDSNTKLTYKWI